MDIRADGSANGFCSLVEAERKATIVQKHPPMLGQFLDESMDMGGGDPLKVIFSSATVFPERRISGHSVGGAGRGAHVRHGANGSLGLSSLSRARKPERQKGHVSRRFGFDPFFVSRGF